MATKPKIQALSQNNAPALLNAIRNDASISYQERVPQATQDNIKEYGSAVLSFSATTNEFLDALMNRIGKVIITSRLYKNPLAMFKKGMLDYGESIEEIFVSLAKARIYSPETAEDEFMKRVIPDVKSIFHKIDYKNFFKVTVQRRDLERAFLSAEGVYTLVDNIIQSLYTGAEYDEFLITKQLIVEYANKGFFYEVQIPEPSADNIHDLVTQVKSYSNQLEFLSTKYNPMGVPTYSDKSRQYIIMDTSIDAMIDVNVLAAAFNMDKAEFMGRKVLIDNFGKLTGAKIALVDEAFFQIYDVLLQFESVRNPEGLYWNYFLHKWNVFSVSRFAPAILFTTAENEITNITIAPTSGSHDNGSNFNITATLSKTGYPNTKCNWTLSGNESTETTLTYVSGTETTQTYKLTIGRDERIGSQLKVTVQSEYFPDATATATYTVRQA